VKQKRCAIFFCLSIFSHSSTFIHDKFGISLLIVSQFVSTGIHFEKIYLFKANYATKYKQNPLTTKIGDFQMNIDRFIACTMMIPLCTFLFCAQETMKKLLINLDYSRLTRIIRE
jgi:hypothetical protein